MSPVVDHGHDHVHEHEEVQEVQQVQQKEQVQEVNKPVRKHRRWTNRKSDPGFNDLSDEEKKEKILSSKIPTDICIEGMEHILNMGIGRGGAGSKLIRSIPLFDAKMKNSVYTSVFGSNKTRKLENAEKIIENVKKAVSA
jgi:hypothetical protein